MVETTVAVETEAETDFDMDDFESQYIYLRNHPEERRDPDVLIWWSLLKYMFGVPMTLYEIGHTIGLSESGHTMLSRERVRQIERVCMRKVNARFTYTPDDGVSSKRARLEQQNLIYKTRAQKEKEGQRMKPLISALNPPQPQHSELEFQGMSRKRLGIPEPVIQINVLHGTDAKTFYKSVSTKKIQYYKDNGQPFVPGYVPACLANPRPSDIITYADDADDPDTGGGAMVVGLATSYYAD